VSCNSLQARSAIEGKTISLRWRFGLVKNCRPFSAAFCLLHLYYREKRNFKNCAPRLHFPQETFAIKQSKKSPECVRVYIISITMCRHNSVSRIPGWESLLIEKEAFMQNEPKSQKNCRKSPVLILLMEKGQKKNELSPQERGSLYD
jgi:hypothetical protein